MADEKRKLVREAGTVQPRTGRLDRAEESRDEDRHETRPGCEAREERAPRSRGGRSRLRDEAGDLNRGGMFVGVEAAALVMDIASRVLRNAVDRAFDEDYESPGDLARGVANEADESVLDLLGEFRAVPRRLSTRFDSAMRSPRADQGERHRRTTEANSSTAADVPPGRKE